MKTGYIKQHIVPKCYLDRFAEYKNGKYIIGTRYVDDNGVVKLFSESTSEVCYVKKFYDVTDKEDEKHWEHFLANEIDSLFSNDLENIISSIVLSGNGYRLTDDNVTTLSKIVVSQSVRVPESVNYVLDNLYPKVAKEVKNYILAKLPEDIRIKKKSIIDSIEMTKQSQKESYFNYFFNKDNFNKLVRILEHNIWSVFVNTVSNTCPFITSDNPVIVENLDDPNRIGVFRNGIANTNTCFFFPLTPSIAAVSYSKKSHINIAANEINRKIIKLDEEKYIITKNSRIMEQAFRHSFIPQPLFDYLMNIDEK
ncbi:MAG: DUF4238 domain-containing protein [Bacteroidales bacterium]|nr:DUF4238 domain-containing protein [Bacteroidales bacterium]